jgi:[acyl-carrier-protein] S-malonyltransferase
MSEKAVVFAGQGAQFVGMGKDIAERYQECRTIFQKADDILGYELSKICFNGPEEELKKTNHCQPAIFVVSVACYRALEIETQGKVTFAATAGLSLGEWTALHIAGAVTFEDAIRILEARGRFMQEACEERKGGMISIIGLPLDKIQTICKDTGVEISNINSDNQIVLSGEQTAIEQASKLAQSAGARRVIPLNVAGAYHSSLMSSAAKRLEEMLTRISIKEPSLPVISNVTGLPHSSPDNIRREMVRQVVSTVQWVACVKWMQTHGIATYLECGPGRVLNGLIKNIDKNATIYNVQDFTTLQSSVQAFRTS